MFTPKKIENALARLFDLFDPEIMEGLYENYGEEIEISYITVTQRGKFAFEADFAGEATVTGEGTIKDGKTKPISFEAIFDYKPAEERQYIFEHAWQQVKDKFYKEDIHGIDWDGYRKAYHRFLPSINNNLQRTYSCRP